MGAVLSQNEVDSLLRGIGDEDFGEEEEDIVDEWISLKCRIEIRINDFREEQLMIDQKIDLLQSILDQETN